MSAQYRFSLIQVLRLFTPAMGIIVIAMACLAVAPWIFGSGVFGPWFANQSGNPGAGFSGITPDAALCFILCGISLWALRESREKGNKGAHVKSPAEKFFLEAALVRASLIKVPDDYEDADKAGGAEFADSCEAGAGALEFETSTTGARGYWRRLARICATATAVISVAALAGYLFGWDTGVANAATAVSAANAAQGAHAAHTAHVDGWLVRLGAVTGYWSGPASLSASIRMAPSAALGFLLNGAALALLDVETRRRSRPAQHLALIALFLSVVIALAHAYQIPVFYSFIAARG